MNALLEIPALLYLLLIQLACGIVFASQFAPGERSFLRQQSLFAFTFLFLAPLICLLMTRSISPAEARPELYCIGALGVGLIADFWLKYEPGARTLETILNWLMALIALFLLYALSLPYTSVSGSDASSLVPFFLFLGSSLLLGAIWTAMTGTRRNFEAESPLPGSAFFARLLFLACSGFVLTAIFTSLALPLHISPHQAIPATPESIAGWHAWHCGLSGFAVLAFLVAVYRTHLIRSKDTDDTIPGLPAMGFAFIFALLGEACGRVAFLASYAAA